MRSPASNPLAGVGFKPQHLAEATAYRAEGFWLEVHPENYLVPGGPRLAALEAVRDQHPLSLHGVGLSLASDQTPDAAHLKALRGLIDRFDPFVFSEHLAWNSWGGRYSPDLLPFPRTKAALQRISANISRTQDVLGRSILIENPSHYLPLKGHELGEVEFLAALCRKTGCGLLLDINNVHVSANNIGTEARDWLDAVPGDLVGEIHLAGFSPDPVQGDALLIDSHAAPVAEPVWRLFEDFIARIGPRPVLIERDEDIPAFGALAAEAQKARQILNAASFAHV